MIGRTIMFLIAGILLFNASLSALELKYEIHPSWRMLVCAGFGYSLEFNNTTGTFRLQYGSECETVIKPVFIGKFKIEKESLILDFGDIKAYYYLKSPYEPACDNILDSLSEAEQKLVCDPTHFSDFKDLISPNMKDKVFIKESALFPSKVEGVGKDEWSKELLRVLRSHCFIALKEGL